MNKISLFFLVTIAGFSCRQDATSAKDNAGPGWSKTFRKDFVANCITKVPGKVNASEAFDYCDCIADKIEGKYNKEKEVAANFSKNDEDEMKKGCPVVKGMGTLATAPEESNPKAEIWSAEDQQDFTDNCIAETNKRLGKAEAVAYCNCMLGKIMQESPSSKDVGNISKSRLNLLGKDCLANK